MSFETQVATIESVELDKLFDTAPEGTPNADTLSLGKEFEDGSQTIASIGDIPVLTEEDLTLLDEGKNIEPKVDDNLADDTLTDEEKVQQEKEKEEKEKEELEKKKQEENKDLIPQINEVLKNTVDYLVTNGIWSDFDGREDLEMTQEVYAELAAKQNQHSALEIVNELIDSTGDYGKAIINHIKSGGNPDEIIDLFKEQKQLESIDTSTDKGKQEKIEKYYKEVLGWKSEKVEKVIKRLVEDNDIDSEFNDVEELYNKHYQEKLAETQQETIRRQEENKKRQEAFVNNIKSSLQEDTSLSEKDRKVIASSILDFKHKLDNGQKVNDFYLKFAEIQSDPKEYIKLVRFVMDRDNYEKQLQEKAQTKAAKEVFNFVKGNAAIDKARTSTFQEKDEKGKSVKQKGTDFSFVLKK